MVYRGGDQIVEIAARRRRLRGLRDVRAVVVSLGKVSAYRGEDCGCFEICS